MGWPGWILWPAAKLTKREIGENELREGGPGWGGEEDLNRFREAREECGSRLGGEED